MFFVKDNRYKKMINSNFSDNEPVFDPDENLFNNGEKEDNIYQNPITDFKTKSKDIKRNN